MVRMRVRDHDDVRIEGIELASPALAGVDHGTAASVRDHRSRVHAAAGGSGDRCSRECLKT
jgi:hypothetical protein